MKVCSICTKTKPRTEFHRNAHNRDGLNGYCKPCNSAKANRWNRENRDRKAAQRLRRLYGLTPEEHEALLLSQSGKCANPGCSRDAIHVDHDHSTGKVRGILCGQCNHALGLLADDPALISGLVTYLTSA